MNIVEKARAMRRAIDSAAEVLTDDQAIECADLYREWDGGGVLYEVGQRVLYNSQLYKCLQAHTSQDDWAPDVAPSLFARVLAGQGGTDIGVWEQPDSTNGYMIGDRVHYPTASDPVYECTIDNNVWSPAAYPAGWKVLGDN